MTNSCYLSVHLNFIDQYYNMSINQWYYRTASSMTMCRDYSCRMGNWELAIVDEEASTEDDIKYKKSNNKKMDHHSSLKSIQGLIQRDITLLSNNNYNPSHTSDINILIFTKFSIELLNYKIYCCMIHSILIKLVYNNYTNLSLYIYTQYKHNILLQSNLDWKTGMFKNGKSCIERINTPA